MCKEKKEKTENSPVVGRRSAVNWQTKREH